MANGKDYVRNDVLNVVNLLLANETEPILELSEIGLDSFHVRMISKSLETNTNLVNLSLTGNYFHGECGLANALKLNRTLEQLDLYQNLIGDEGAIAIAEALLHNTSLTFLGISYNNLASAGLTAIVKMLEINSTLTDVNIGGHRISIEVMHTIAQMLKINGTLVRLYLHESDTDNKGALILADALIPSKPLSYLSLNDNPRITNKGKRALKHAAEIHETRLEIAIPLESKPCTIL
jgi:Ran GTPase-activating protein (RanGAP) involved in mRNA processing and transport